MSDWLQKYGTTLLITLTLVALPLLYFGYTIQSWQPLNPHEHLIQNVLAYFFLVLFSYFNHTIFVPRWFLNKRYYRYAAVAIACILAAVYFPYRIEQWAFFKKPQENTAFAWTRQVFWAEMMLGGPDGPDNDGTRHVRPRHLRPHDERPDRPPFDQSSAERPPWPNGPAGLPTGPHDGGDGPHIRTISVILPAKLAIYFLLGSVSSLISILIQATNRLRRVENDQLQAELRQLKAQIQPHFLFNTLNSIYALAIRNDDRTADTIVKLSDFLRYIIRDAHHDKVPLAAEVNYIGNYIELQKARLRDAVEVNYQLHGQPNGLMIAPLLLSSFIENAFKYGVNPEEESPIDILLHIQEDALELTVTNNKVQVNQIEESTGIGLRNTAERLRLTYPEAHTLLIDDTDKQFRIQLYLKLI